VHRPKPPAVSRPAWLRDPIDAFILARLDKKKIAPSPEADRATLIRRASFDLLGIPPTIDEVDAFVADRHPDAYDRLVDRLLASPRFGERWGRHWLDVARYADSDGYTNDEPRVMWAYRDWVIDAINRDLPFDQFTVDQIAGDLLPRRTTEQLIATGFHRNTQHNREGGSDPEEYRVLRVVDRVETTGAAFLGLTLGCARCHSHKFDPITQREFFQVYAFFNSTEEPKAAVTSRGVKTTTLVTRELKKPRRTYVHERGDFLEHGPSVAPGVPAVLPPLQAASRRRLPNRLDFARWIVSPTNPLTPRVVTNRWWQHYFGRGIVETESDFGVQAPPRSHPMLLDLLAADLVRRGWSMKGVHRRIVTSAVYRQASTARPELRQIDARNVLLARQSRLRLSAEPIRDASLSAAGLLSSKIGGPSVYPPQPDGVMDLTRNPNRKWIPSKGADRYRRAMYTYFWRSTPHPFLRAFDAPESNTTCTRRDRSNTPLQALTLLNDAAFVEAAQALAERVLREMPDAPDPQRLRVAFRLCLSRHPTESELRTLTELLEAERAELRKPDKPERAPESAPALPAAGDLDRAERSAWISVARVLLNLDEFLTRE
jgi:hypothetical protein